jgi:hypothetical protein
VLDVYRMYLHLRVYKSTRWNVLVECDTPGRDECAFIFEDIVSRTRQKCSQESVRETKQSLCVSLLLSYVLHHRGHSRKYDLVVTHVAGDKRTLVRNGNENENENNLTDLPNVFSGVAQCSMRTYRMNFMTAEITTKEKTQLSDRTCQMCSQELVSAQCVSYVP